ncbi:hypothetical protein ANANG_G00149950, partial [Anguilla anguilla]
GRGRGRKGPSRVERGAKTTFAGRRRGDVRDGELCVPTETASERRAAHTRRTPAAPSAGAPAVPPVPCATAASCPCWPTASTSPSGPCGAPPASRTGCSGASPARRSVSQEAAAFAGSGACVAGPRLTAQ